MRKNRWTALLLLLALALQLVGCSGPQKADGPTPPSSGNFSSANNAVIGRSAFAGVKEPEDIEISDEEMDEIRTSAEMMEGIWRDNAGEGVEVTHRDWSIYSSDLGKLGLTEEEAKLYDRFVELGERYIANDSLDGIVLNNGAWYVSDRVLYGDLGLVAEQARNMSRWFLYNNPQYYFFTGATSTNSAYISLGIYPFVSDGEERAEVTNALFDKLDGWIEQVNSQAATTY